MRVVEEVLLYVDEGVLVEKLFYQYPVLVLTRQPGPSGSWLRD